MAKAALPFPKRIQDAVDKIGTHNGTRIPDPDVPMEFQGDNERTNAFLEKHARTRDFLVASLVKKQAESNYERAKSEMLTAVGITDMVPGDSKSYVFGNVTLNARAQKGQTRIDRQKLLTKLMTDQKMTLVQASAFVEDVENTGKPVMYLTPSTVAE